MVSCSAGYNGSSEKEYRCQSGVLGPVVPGEPVPHCTPLECPYNMPSVPGVGRNCDGIGANGTCNATGEAGHAAVSNPRETLTCGARREFYGTSPTCAASTCNALLLSSAYDVTACADVTTGQTCLVSCAQGWELSSNATSYTCQGSGIASGSPPTCIPRTCTGLGTLGAELDTSGCDSRTTGQTCKAKCANGYAGNFGIFACMLTGVLEGASPTCFPLAGSPRLCLTGVASPTR